MRKLLKIFFTNTLQKTSSGFSIGGAVFPLEMITEFDESNNALLLKQGWRLLFLANTVEIGDPSGSNKITISDEKIQKVEIVFEQRND